MRAEQECTEGARAARLSTRLQPLSLDPVCQLVWIKGIGLTKAIGGNAALFGPPAQMLARDSEDLRYFSSSQKAPALAKLSDNRFLQCIVVLHGG
jgi:hypothetical protein